MQEFFITGWEKDGTCSCPSEVNLLTFRELPVGPLSKSLLGQVPAPRSGHRIFTDDEFLYVIGGFDRTPEDREGKIYREVWRYNLFTQEWVKMDASGEFPTALASFALAQSAPYSNQVLLFGGTAVPFGATTSSSVHLLSFDSDSNSLVSTVLPVDGEKLATYGHAMVRGPDPHTFYVIGGTTGHIFFLDVDKLSFVNGKWTWSNEAHTTPNEEGRYRLETVLHEDLIYFFGGGRPDYVTELQNLTVFNTKTKKVMEVPTFPDEDWVRPELEEFGFPKGRRCHSVTKWKRKAIVVGGCSADKDDDDVRRVDMFDDVWSFDLDTHRWKRMPFNLAVPVFFHDATITKEGCLIVWGGVLDIYSSVRTSAGQYCFLEPPSLKTLAAMALRPYLSYKTVEESNGLRFSRVMDVVREICCKESMEMDSDDS
ncbi:hypothetical protein Y032_0297g1720 [Ancylostoma ceylanicum]|nr:hypothetical protein Y032_0297g1720 [Ancylostoma ceylanicum]